MSPARDLLFGAILLSAAACTASVGVMHTVPAPYGIAPAKSVAVVGMGDPGDDLDGQDDAFLSLFIAKLGQASQGLFAVVDGRELARRVAPKGGVGDAASVAAFHQVSPVEVIARVSSPYVLTRCTVEAVDDVRHRGTVVDDYYQAECGAGLTLYSAATGQQLAVLSVTGHGESADDGPDASDAATKAALDDAAGQLVAGIAPAQLEEQVDIDRHAPLATEGLAKIDHGDLAGARQLWENGLSATPDSALLHANLAAVCEALGDAAAAREHYAAAVRLAPGERKYQQALRLLQGRDHDAALAVQGDPAQLAAAKAAAAEEKEAAAARAATAVAAAAAAKQSDAQKTAAAQARALLVAKAPLHDEKSTVTFLLLPAGTFAMGCTAGDPACDDDEKPARPVTIGRPFYLASTPTTNAQYQRCLAAGACTGKAAAAAAERTHPVVGVDWAAASAFCAWAGGRLPTEAEWEYAARGGTAGWRYPKGNDLTPADANYALTTKGNFQVKSLAASPDAARIFGLTYPHQGTTPVQAFPVNGFALSDMAGNVLQWTADPAAATGSTGPAAASSAHILRGGSWAVTSDALRVSSRYTADPTTALSTIGFRCARDADLR